MIVARGLGRGAAGALVAAGLGLSLQVVVIAPPVVAPMGPPPEYHRAETEFRVYKPAKVTLPAVRMQALLAEIEARGEAHLVLLTDEGVSRPGAYRATGASSAKLLGVSADSKVGSFLAKGAHDLSDEEIAAMLLQMLS